MLNENITGFLLFFQKIFRLLSTGLRESPELTFQPVRELILNCMYLLQ